MRCPECDRDLVTGRVNYGATSPRGLVTWPYCVPCNMRFVRLDIDDVTPREDLRGSPRRHGKSHLQELAASLQVHGQEIPIIVDEHLHVLDGDKRVAMLRALGAPEVVARVCAQRTA